MRCDYRSDAFLLLVSFSKVVRNVRTSRANAYTPLIFVSNGTYVVTVTYLNRFIADLYDTSVLLNLVVCSYSYGCHTKFRVIAKL